MIESQLISFIKTSSTACKNKKTGLVHIFWDFRQPEKNVVYAKSLWKLLPHLLTVDFARGLFMIYIQYV